MSTYREHIGKYENGYLINKETNKIDWKWVKVLVSELAKNEHKYLLREHRLRDKMDHYKWKMTTREEKENAILNAPIIYRQAEKYINPEVNGWERRYKLALKCGTAKEYIRTLNWVYNYYRGDKSCASALGIEKKAILIRDLVSECEKELRCDSEFIDNVYDDDEERKNKYLKEVLPRAYQKKVIKNMKEEHEEEKEELLSEKLYKRYIWE